MGAQIRDESNLFLSLDADRTPSEVAELFARRGWRARKADWVAWEIRSEEGELVIEDTCPLLMHGAVAPEQDVIERVLAVLRNALIPHHGEWYDEQGELRREFAWGMEAED